ncbi:hypothetical protein WKW80_35405 [Variovorax humicola]|uniref:Uncharacterized protein n=1 Tax=Variovorax humicola TaxID=1769758 RepID=A0ABU8WBB2_9BURK
MNISVSASARNTFFSANASSDFTDAYSFSSDSITWMVSLNAKYGEREIFNERIKTDYAPLLKEPVELANRCGDEIVSLESRSATVAAIFTASNFRESRERALNVNLTAETGAGLGWDGRFSSSYRNFVKTASAGGRADVDVWLIGGDGTKKVGALIRDFSDIDEVSRVLSDQIQTLNFYTAKATSFKTTSLKRYGWKGEQLAVSRIDSSLEDYYSLYKDAKALKQRAYEIISSDSSGRVRLSSSQRDSMRGLLMSSDLVMQRLIDAAEACRKDATKCVASTTFELPVASWPKLDPVGRMTLQSNHTKCRAAAVIAIPEVKFYCDQVATFQVIGRWADVVSVEAIDRDGTSFPVTLGPPVGLPALYAQAKRESNDTISEAEFCELTIGEWCEDVASAAKRGWSAKSVALSAKFGSTDNASEGLRRTLSAIFRTQGGDSEVRAVFMQ